MKFPGVIHEVTYPDCRSPIRLVVTWVFIQVISGKGRYKSLRYEGIFSMLRPSFRGYTFSGFIYLSFLSWSLTSLLLFLVFSWICMVIIIMMSFSSLSLPLSLLLIVNVIRSMDFKYTWRSTQNIYTLVYLLLMWVDVCICVYILE